MVSPPRLQTPESRSAANFLLRVCVCVCVPPLSHFSLHNRGQTAAAYFTSWLMLFLPLWEMQTTVETKSPFFNKFRLQPNCITDALRSRIITNEPNSSSQQVYFDPFFKKVGHKH